MKMVIMEPLGVEKETLLSMAGEALGERAELVYYDTRTTDPEELIKRGEDAQIILVSNLPLSAQVIEGFGKLKLLAVAFTGVDHISMETCRKKGITVCNCAGYSNAAVADLVFGMLICLYRNIIPCNQACREEGVKGGLAGFELEGKKFGVVGTGAIGLKVASIALAFGCQVLAYSRTQKDLPGIRYVDLDALLKECDVVSLHTPVTPETTGLMNRERIGLMKKNAVLINTARGPIVDSLALAEALKEGKLGGACIDVFENEPPISKDYPLFSAPNTIVTPHIAFATKEALVKRAVILFDNIVKYLDGAPQNVIK